MRRSAIAGVLLVAMVAGSGAARAAFGGAATADATLSTATLEPVSDLAATPGCSGLLSAQATVTWSATPSVWATGYRLERLRGSTVELDTTVTPQTTTSYADGPLSLATTYTWRLTAFLSNWTSPTVSVSATTPLLC